MIRVGFDLDGTVVDVSKLYHDFNQWCVRRGVVDRTIDKSKYPFDDQFPGLARSELDAFNESIASRWTKEYPIRPGVQELFKALLEAGVEPVFITARGTIGGYGDYSDAQAIDDTKAMLYKAGLSEYEVYFTNNKVLTMSQNGVSVLIDDSPDELRLAKKSHKIMIFDNEYNRDVEGERIYNFKVKSFMRTLGRVII